VVEARLGVIQNRTLVHQRLLEVGHRVTASVTGLRAVAPASGEVELDLVFELDGIVHGVTHRQAVAKCALAALALGTLVPVLVDPADPVSLVIA
jgi:hypothetical protein